MIARLDDHLNAKWQEYKQTHLGHHTTVPFHLFASWIKTQAKIQLDRQENNPTESTPQSKFGNSRFNPTKTSSPTPSRRNTYSREYNDTIRSRRNYTTNYSSNPSNSTFYNSGRNNTKFSQLDTSTTGSEFEQPLHESAHSATQNSTRTNNNLMELQCAWCLSTNQPHRHLTSNCIKLPHQDQMEQWKTIYKYRVCSRCLGNGHYYKSCTINTPPCNTCHIPHHKNLACRPRETIATKFIKD